MPLTRLVRIACVWVGACVVPATTGSAQRHPERSDLSSLALRAAYGDAASRAAALRAIRAEPGDPTQYPAIFELLRKGHTNYKKVRSEKLKLQVAIVDSDGDDQKLAVEVQLPRKYDPNQAYPLMVAMGGGPVPSRRHAKRQATMMAKLWHRSTRAEGWLLATINDTVSLVSQSRPLRYSVLRASQFRAVLDAIQQRVHVDTNRVHATGVSLGANYAVAFAGANPDWFAGVVPVSSEGESREWVLRSLNKVAVFALSGCKDRNIRSIEGPRRMNKILDSLGSSNLYVEDKSKGHESFQQEYPRAITFLAERPRKPFPTSIWRMAHRGILPPAKRMFWAEADTHQAIFAVSINAEKNQIDLLGGRMAKMTFYLSDELLDLDKEVTVHFQHRDLFKGKVKRSLVHAIEDLHRTGDPLRFSTARLEIRIKDPLECEEWIGSVAPKMEPSELPFWEAYAIASLHERPSVLPATVVPVEDDEGLRVTEVPGGSALKKGDLLLAVDGERIFGAISQDFLKRFLVRLGKTTVTCEVERDEELIDVEVKLLPGKATPVRRR